MNSFDFQLVAHEIGHNLGMNHDFTTKPGNMRRTRTGKACTGIGGIMDYTSRRKKWSPCSVQDLNDYYNAFRGKFCLATDTPTTTTTTR